MGTIGKLIQLPFQWYITLAWLFSFFLENVQETNITLKIFEPKSEHNFARGSLQIHPSVEFPVQFPESWPSKMCSLGTLVYEK